MNIKQKIHIFFSDKEQLNNLQDADNVRYDNSVYPFGVYNLSFIREYKNGHFDSNEITRFEVLQCFEFALFNFISALIILFTSHYFILWFNLPFYIFSLSLLIACSLVGLVIGKINKFQKTTPAIKPEAIMVFEKYCLNKNVEESRKSKDPLPSIPRKRL